MLRTTLRLLGAGLAILTASAALTGTATYLTLDGTDWTDPRPAATLTPVPRPGPTPTPASTARWNRGTCVTPDLQPTPCTPGVWQLVDVVHRPGPSPCAGITSYPDTRYGRGIALCLARY